MGVKRNDSRKRKQEKMYEREVQRNSYREIGGKDYVT